MTHLSNPYNPQSTRKNITIAESADYSIVTHQSGDVYVMRQGGSEGTEAFGPLHHTEIPATIDEADAILDNQTADDRLQDGDWLQGEINADRAHVTA